jgi:hypothetical protein
MFKLIRSLTLNIFYLDSDIQKCVEYSIDKHVVKMPLESAQMLCTAILLNDGEAKYRMSHKNHPSSIWARTTRDNFLYLCKLGIALCEEHKYRYDKDKYHASYQVILDCMSQAHLIPEGDFTEPPQCMPEEYRASNAVDGYRTFYIQDKKSFASWKKRPQPDWWQWIDLEKAS